MKSDGTDKICDAVKKELYIKLVWGTLILNNWK